MQQPAVWRFSLTVTRFSEVADFLFPFIRCEDAANLSNCSVILHNSSALTARQHIEARLAQDQQDREDRAAALSEDSSVASLGFSIDSDGHWHEHRRDIFYDRRQVELDDYAIFARGGDTHSGAARLFGPP